MDRAQEARAAGPRRRAPHLALMMPLLVAVGCEGAGETARASPRPASQRTPSARPAHEPSGWIPVADQPWDALASDGWGHRDRSSRSRIVADATAPASPPHVLEHRYPAGFPGGQEPAVDWLPVAGRAAFVSLWMKVSDPWTNHRSHVNKIWFLWLADDAGRRAGNFYLSFLPAASGRWRLRMAPERPGHDWTWIEPNQADPTFTLGEWVRVEALLAHRGGERWHVRWWVDGVLAADDPDVAHGDLRLDQFELAPTWGGIGGMKPRAEHVRFDHVYVSRPP